MKQTQKMNKNIKDIENKGLLKAFLKNEYPRYMSKDFSEKVMTDIYSQKTNNSAKTYLIRVASALVFGIFTLALMDNMLSEDIQYTRTDINTEVSAPSRNVSNQIEECKKVNDKEPASDIIECK